MQKYTRFPIRILRRLNRHRHWKKDQDTIGQLLEKLRVIGWQEIREADGDIVWASQAESVFIDERIGD